MRSWTQLNWDELGYNSCMGSRATGHTVVGPDNLLLFRRTSNVAIALKVMLFTCDHSYVW